MGIIAQRPPADKPGPDIVSSVLTDLESQLERGRQEINYNVPDKLITSGRILEVSYIRPGDMAEIKSGSETIRGKVLSFGISVRGADIAATLSLEVPK